MQFPITHVFLWEKHSGPHSAVKGARQIAGTAIRARQEDWDDSELPHLTGPTHGSQVPATTKGSPPALESNFGGNGKEG